MINLANYGSSSSSSDDENLDLSSSPTQPSSSSHGFLKALPKPIHAISDVVEGELEAEVTRKRAWEADELILPKLPKKPPIGRARIMLPQFDQGGGSESEDEEPKPQNNKNITCSKSNGSSLLSLLPKPTTSSSSCKQTPFKIDSVKKAEPATSSATLFKPSTIASKGAKSATDKIDKGKSANSQNQSVMVQSVKPKLLATDYGSESESDAENEERANDFFSLSAEQNSGVVDFAEEDYNSPDFNAEAESYAAQSVNRAEIASAPASHAHPSLLYNLAATASADAAAAAEFYERRVDDAAADDARIRRLIGVSESLDAGVDADAAAAALPSDFQIIDVSVDQHLGDVRENLLKNLTQKPVDAMLVAAQMAAKGVGGPGAKSSKDKKFDQTAKRKHQITYLAHLAKEREEDLKNQWAHSRQRRQEARMKYGF